MPLLGTEFNAIIDLKSDNAYSPYFDTAKKNRILREAINKAISTKIATNDRQQIQNDLFGIYKSNQVFTPTSNTLDLILGGSGITDYFCIMNAKCKFLVPITDNYIASAPSGNTPILISLYGQSNIRTGQQILISGITGNTNANGTRYVKMVSPSRYRLYSDVNLLTAVVSNGSYSGTSGVINQIFYNYATDMHSVEKSSRLNEATEVDPQWEVADAVLKIYPMTRQCSEVTVDYISLPVYIDVADSTIDYLETYSTTFIDYISDQWCILAGESARDEGLILNNQTEIAVHP